MTVASDDDSVRILRLRLAVARAAQRDSLSWWEDSALTPDADVLLRRLFPRSSHHAARTLALRAARSRHEAVLADWPQARHLFDFGAEDENRLDESLRKHKPVDIWTEPIRSRGELADVLRTFTPEPDPLSLRWTDAQRTIQLGEEVLALPIEKRAITLAWAYTVPEAFGLVVPFYLPTAGAT